MKTYKIKEEYRSNWRCEVNKNPIIDAWEVKCLAYDWGMSVDELLEQLEEVDVWTVVQVGGEYDGYSVAMFENEALATNFGHDHADDYPLGCAIFAPDGSMIVGW